MAKISVIIPVYNVESYLTECLDSVVNQTFDDLEIICVNDGSTDNSPEILNEYKSKDNRIRIINQENKGLGAARNSGLSVATGDYIYFIDSDDYLELNALNELYRIAEENSLDLIIFKLINFHDETREEFKHHYHEMNMISKSLGNKFFSYSDLIEFLDKLDVTVYTKFFKRDLIINLRFDEDLIFEDNLFMVEYIFNANRIYFYDDYLYHRRIRAHSIMTEASKNHMDSIEVSNRVINTLKEHGFYESTINRFFTKKINILNYRINSIDDKYKEEFFNRIKEDLIEKKEEYEEYVDFNLINERTKFIFYNMIESKDYGDFTLKKELYDKKI